MTKASDPEPTDSMCMFGAMVQGLREQAGLSREEFGRLVRFSKHTVASVELGRRMPDMEFATAAGEALGQPELVQRVFEKVSRKRPGLAMWFQRWADLETEAICLYTYECRVVPGLLQTDAYACTLFEHRLPPLSDEGIQTKLEARKERQKLLLERPHTSFSFVLDEHLLLRQTGGPEVTRELLEHLLDLSARRNVEIQVLPMSMGVHPGVNGPIRLLETPENQWFAYAEGQRTGELVTDPEAISVLQMRYARLRAQALDSIESAELLKRLRGSL
ncbi:helix-turn-helix domain-containing protein [Streptomyces odontomachi]|uniref:helix-turn-helix domain-containing protein n=1 Tax=Streptomyces odontomachi TaxID=2944940 RepID=UPI002109BB6E|nr:helix-turn-helix transcriptional regulator [Streptomyces sp. ODS25]